jgi:hypothetical protein
MHRERIDYIITILCSYSGYGREPPREPGMPIHAVVYASQVAEGLPTGRLEALVRDAARFNVIAGVTGLLLFDGERFLQYLEGPTDGLHAAFDRVLTSSSHIDVMQLARGLVGSRLCPFWSMTLVEADRRDLGKIATADWNSFVRRGNGVRPTAVDHLIGFVDNHRQEVRASG